MPQIDNLPAVPYTEMPAWHTSFLSSQLIIIPDVSAVRAIMLEALSECCKKCQETPGNLDLIRAFCYNISCRKDCRAAVLS